MSARAQPRHGCPMSTGCLQDEGWRVNRRRVCRPWRQGGLKRAPGFMHDRTESGWRMRLTSFSPERIEAILCDDAPDGISQT